MKFIVFNIVVAAALIYLVANKDNGVDIALPNLNAVTAAALQQTIAPAHPARVASATTM